MDEEDHTEEQTEQSTEETSQIETVEEPAAPIETVEEHTPMVTTEVPSNEDTTEVSNTESTGGDEGAGSSFEGDEAKVKMEAKKIRDKEKQAQEMAEYEEMRKDEREKEEREIKELRERRERRRKERQEEEKRLTELRKIEEARRKAEEEEKKKKKKEEEQSKKEEREKKLKDAEERLKPKKPNYVIAKKGGEEGGPKEPTSKEDMQKSKEQLEEEKRAILAQRIQPLAIDGLNAEKLREKAKELHDHLRKLASDKFDCEENYKRQQKDLIELAERARQLSKGKGKKTSGDVQRVDDSFDNLADKYAGCPPKILLHSKYERLTDHRSYGERKDLYEKVSKELEELIEKDRIIKEHQRNVRTNVGEGEGGEGGEGEEAPQEEEVEA
ncbi:troponin T, skeletal muscle isoform X10 [Octopus sinensis]|uniref:Troponin T, skeletal muscle isoform X10 n=1 Tax=Octopus sinensis TaxID=2607531 RepID=A0A6P7SK07_9MOLL|nr:troponin T, skeletal muscle isoform X10 [Octopus sinensis]